MDNARPYTIFCNGANQNNYCLTEEGNYLKLEYRRDQSDEQNIKISLSSFVKDVFYLPDRILDLLEIASYIFSADRLIKRGEKDAVEYHSWARTLHFIIKVRDIEFWERPVIKEKLCKALCFMSGDREFQFTFIPGHQTPPTNLFDFEEFQRNDSEDNTSIVLFSGGLDSLAGVIELLETSPNNVYLVSHQSQPGTTRTQNQLVEALKVRYPNRIQHYKFQCNLSNNHKAREETQRTRAFLYLSIAFSLANACRIPEIYVFENGITSINFPRRQDLMNARASRTTHPKTLYLMQEFFSEFDNEYKCIIKNPYLWKTKTDVLSILATYKRQDLLSSSVSCSKTFLNLTIHTHCGGCSQCIDRRFAAYSLGLNEYDDTGIYDLDFIRNEINDNEVKTVLIDYIRQAKYFASWNIDYFYEKSLNELAQITDYIDIADEQKAVEKVWDLCKRHGTQVLLAIKRIREIYDNPFTQLTKGSLLDIINEREYLKDPVNRLVESVCKRLSDALPIAFKNNQPKDENDFNDKVSAIINTDKDKFEREHPAIRFGLAHSIPDHSWNDFELLIESKYIRKSTSPSKAAEGIAADLIKYPEYSYKLFIVYDPYRSIVNDNIFKADFEKKGNCTICIIR